MNQLGDFQIAASNRLYDGLAVELGRSDATGAAYLYGYAIECALKAGFFALWPGVRSNDAWDAVKHNLKSAAAHENARWGRAGTFHDLDMLRDAYLYARGTHGTPLNSVELSLLGGALQHAVSVWSVELRYSGTPTPSADVEALRTSAETLLSLI